jgi:hypothetical protein
MRCALGLVMHKLGINYYDSEEGKEGLACMKKSLELMDSLPDAFKLRHLNTIQDLFNHIAIIVSDRGGTDEEEDKLKNLEALDNLNKAKEIYDVVQSQAEHLPQKRIITNFDKFILGQAKNSGKSKEDSHFSFFINQGLDLQKLERQYTTTLFVMAQVH